MRRMMGLLLVVGLSLSNIGCVAAVGNRHTIKPPSKQAVALHGEIYIVDLDDGSVCKIDRDAVEGATTISEVEVEIEDG